MLKNNKGITMVMLVVTVVAMLILATVTVTGSADVITSTTRKKVISNMYILKAEVETRIEEFSFSEDTTILVGTKVTDNTKIDSFETEYNAESTAVEARGYWYEITKTDLETMDLDSNMLSNSEEYLVNYYTGEIIYTKGSKDLDGNIEYTFKDIVGGDTSI